MCLGVQGGTGGDRVVKEGTGEQDTHHEICSPHEADGNARSTGRSLLLCLLIHQMFIELLLCARHHFRAWVYNSGQNTWKFLPLINS